MEEENYRKKIDQARTEIAKAQDNLFETYFAQIIDNSDDCSNI